MDAFNNTKETVELKKNAVIKLMSSDGQIFETDTISVSCMDAVMTMLAAIGNNDSKQDTLPIPLPNLRSHILRKLLTYANYHKDDSKDLDRQNSEYICRWDLEFLNVPQSELFDIIAGANYLEMKNLMDVACRKVANMLENHTTEEMRKMFNIPNDFIDRRKRKNVATERKTCFSSVDTTTSATATSVRTEEMDTPQASNQEIDYTEHWLLNRRPEVSNFMSGNIASVQQSEPWQHIDENLDQSSNRNYRHVQRYRRQNRNRR